MSSPDYEIITKISLIFDDPTSNCCNFLTTEPISKLLVPRMSSSSSRSPGRWKPYSGISVTKKHQNYHSHLLPDEGVKRKISCCQYHFWTFQLELDNLGTKNFEIGSVVKKLQPFEVGQNRPKIKHFFQDLHNP